MSQTPPEQESILNSGLRALVRTIFTILGIAIGLLILAILFVNTKDKPTQNYNVNVLANAEGKRSALPESGPIILQINIHGAIGSESLTASGMNQLLVESREGILARDRVKGVLLSMDTPGGTVSDASGILQALKDYKTRYHVPIIAHVDGLSASGGVMVSCAADKIVATETSLIGSVGVITPPFFNVASLLDKMGVASLTIFAGKDKDELNPFRPWSKTESEQIQDLIRYYYDYFVNIVTEHRPELTKEKLMKEYGARIFPASQAQQYGYIDAAGYSRNDALKLLLAQAKIEGSDYRVVELSNKNWVSELFNSRSPLFTGTIEHRLTLSPEQHPDFQGKFLYYYRP